MVKYATLLVSVSSDDAMRLKVNVTADPLKPCVFECESHVPFLAD